MGKRVEGDTEHLGECCCLIRDEKESGQPQGRWKRRIWNFLSTPKVIVSFYPLCFPYLVELLQWLKGHMLGCGVLEITHILCATGISLSICSRAGEQTCILMLAWPHSCVLRCNFRSPPEGNIQLAGKPQKSGISI